jgi:hypothetical protein
VRQSTAGSNGDRHAVDAGLVGQFLRGGGGQFQVAGIERPVFAIIPALHLGKLQGKGQATIIAHV